MSKDLVQDLHDMHAKFGFHEWLEANKDDKEKMRMFLTFRYKFLQEEMAEMGEAIEAGDSEEIVDALIDLMVVAIGTLDIFYVDAYKAWDQVQNANMAKNAGVKPNRPNPLKLPDLMKPEGWVGPDHTGNHGILPHLFSE
jgi:predicted HAD superfamily Cof-like phosphohydrolase